MMLVNLFAVLLIAAIVWWFWLYQPASTQATGQALEIIVENGVYTPSRISLPAAQEATLTFVRKDQSPCAASLIFPELQISEELPVGRAKKITLPAMAPGTYHFNCQMQMYRGELMVASSQ